jgi:hypothetical protein
MICGVEGCQRPYYAKGRVTAKQLQSHFKINPQKQAQTLRGINNAYAANSQELPFVSEKRMVKGKQLRTYTWSS